MYKMKISKVIILNHLSYDWWKYLTAIILAFFMWEMVFGVTTPKIPADKKIDIYMAGNYIDEDKLNIISDDLLLYFNELEEINIISIREIDNMYAWQHVLALMGARNGDIFVLDNGAYEKLVEQGAFLNLNAYIADETLVVEQELSDDIENTDIYGIILSSLKRFDIMGYDTAEKVIAVTHYSQNKQKAVTLINFLLNE